MTQKVVFCLTSITTGDDDEGLNLIQQMYYMTCPLRYKAKGITRCADQKFQVPIR